MEQSLSAGKCHDRLVLARAVNEFVLGYHILHNLLMPLVVWILKPMSYFPDLQWTWAYHVVLLFLLLRPKWHDVVLKSWLAGAPVLVAVTLVTTGFEKNWHTFSAGLVAASTLITFIQVGFLAKDCGT